MEFSHHRSMIRDIQQIKGESIKDAAVLEEAMNKAKYVKQSSSLQGNFGIFKVSTASRKRSPVCSHLHILPIISLMILKLTL